MATDLLNLLQMIRNIAERGDLSVGLGYGISDVMHDFGVSSATAYRWIDDARHLGADIQRNEFGFCVLNYADIGGRVERWIDLESAKSLGGSLLLNDVF